MRILVVEDDPGVAEFLVDYLTKNQFVVDHQPRIDLGFEAILSVDYAGVILDRVLPDGDGLELIRKVRAHKPNDEIPSFLVMSALTDLADKLAGFEHGAFDYVTKPCEPEELLARIRVILTQKKCHSGFTITAGNITYETYSQSIFANGKEVQLRCRELAVFDKLVRNFRQVITHDRLESAVFGVDEDASSNSLAIHVSRLRKVLKEAGSQLEIKMSRNIGYRLTDCDR